MNRQGIERKPSLRARLLSSALTVGGAVLTWAAWAGTAHADPISAFVVSAIGLTGTAAAIAQTALTLGLTLGASALLGPKAPKATVAERQASVLQLEIGEGPAEVIMGGACTGGALVDTFCYGPDNIWEVRVIRLSDSWIAGLDGFFVNDKFYLFTGNGYVGRDFAEGAEQFLYAEFYDGRPGQAASSFLISASSQSEMPSSEWWTANDRMAGRAYMAIAYRVNDKIWPSGRPSFKFVCRGTRVYDPRKDSTVPGGSGAHRWGNVYTYEYSENAAVNGYNFRRGIWNYAASPAQLIVGPGKGAEEAPPEDEFVAMNICDESVSLKAGGTEARYRIGGVIRADEAWTDVNRDFAAAMAGVIAQRGGGLTIDAGAAKSVVATFTDAELVKGEKKRLRASVERDLLINAVTPKFVDPYQLWQDAAAPVRRSQDDINADGEIREHTLELRLVTSQSQAQRCGEIHRRKSRMMHSANVVLPARFMGLEAGDWVSWTSNRHFAGQTRTFEVQATSEPRIGRIALTLKEAAATVFTWVPASDELSFTAPAYLAAGAPAPLQLQDFSALTEQVTAADGTPRAIVKVRWTKPSEATLQQVVAEIREAGGEFSSETATAQRTVFAGVDLQNPSNLRLSADLLFSHDYEVRLVPMTEPGRLSLPTEWLPLRTPPVTIPVVTGLIAVAAADGVQLIWDAIARIDVTAYAVRSSLSADSAWEDADIVAASIMQNRTFARLDTDKPVTFFVRAMDRSGNMSPTSAVVTAQVVPPANVIRFNAYPNNALVRFTWEPLETQGTYEIRSGETWDQGAVVDRPAGSSTQALWPVRTDTDSLFWLKARSPAGLYSPDAILAVGRQVPLPDRNEVETRDFFTEGWTGFCYDMTPGGGSAVLELDELKRRGDYYDRLSLVGRFYARCYIDQRAASIVQESPTWAEASGTWSEAARPWMELLGDSGSARVESWISLPEDSPSSRIEAWSLEADTFGLISIDASPAVNITHAACRICNGAVVGNNGLLAMQVAVPVEFSLLVDFRPSEDPPGDWTIATFATAAGDWLQLWYDQAAQRVILEDQDGAECSILYPLAEDEVFAIAIWQTATERGFSIGARVDSLFFSTSVAVAGIAFDSVCFARAGLGAALSWADIAALGWTWTDVGPGGEFSMAWSAAYANVGPSRNRARGAFGGVDLHDSAAVGRGFASHWDTRGRIGYSEFQPFYAGDYDFQYADIWMRLAAPNRDGEALAISKGFVTVDVPDVLDGSGEDGIELTAAGLHIEFARPFYRNPAVVPGFASGAELGIAKATNVTTTGFDLQIFKAASPTVPMDGVARWVAKGF